MAVVGNEKHIFKLYPRKPNSSYEWEDKPSIIFRGRPAGQVEQKQYRVQKGVNGNTDSLFIICSNLPKDVKVGDRIVYLSKEWTVNSVGYYFDEARFISPAIMNDLYIISKCPKGINIG